MASTSKVTIMNTSADKIMQVLTNFEAYSDFMEGVSSVTVTSTDGSITRAKYSINVIKKFSYVLDHVTEENKVSWSFVEGDLFKMNSGSWTLNDLGDGSTEVTYDCEVEAKVKVMGSGMIIKTLVNTSLPAMLREVESRAQNL